MIAQVEQAGSHIMEKFNQSLDNQTLINQRDKWNHIRVRRYADKRPGMGCFAKTAAESIHHPRRAEQPAGPEGRGGGGEHGGGVPEGARPVVRQGRAEVRPLRAGQQGVPRPPGGEGRPDDHDG